MQFRRYTSLAVCKAAVALSVSAACTDEAMQPSSLSESSISSEYRVAAGDKLKVTVFGESRASGIHEVDSTGAIASNLIGRTAVQGMTVSEIERRLRDEYRSREILLDPKISVEAVQMRPFFILGEVEKRGSYPYMSGLTVAQAVAAAGGYTYRASRSRISVERRGSGKPEAAKENTLVYPGDVIRVPERYF